MLQGFDRKNSNSWALSRDIDELKYLMKILTMKDSIPISQSPGFSEKHKQYISLSLSLSLFSLSLFTIYPSRVFRYNCQKREVPISVYGISGDQSRSPKSHSLLLKTN